MGIYFSSTITCSDCGNSNTFDTCLLPFIGGNKEITPDDGFLYISKVKPRIICGRCNSEKIKGSDDYFCSVDMTHDHKEDKYIPENQNEIWVLQDNRQRLPDIIYINAENYFSHDTLTNKLINFSDFDRYLQSGEKSSSKIAFHRVKHLSEVQDLYRCDDERYKHCDFCPTYSNRFEKGKSIFDYETEETTALFYFHEKQKNIEKGK